MYFHSDISPMDGCKNLKESYGEICVHCNKCGRFGGEKMDNKAQELLEKIKNNVKIQTMNEILIMINEYMIHLLESQRDLLLSDSPNKEEKLFMIKSQVVVLGQLKDDIGYNIDQLSLLEGDEEDDEDGSDPVS